MSFLDLGWLRSESISERSWLWFHSVVYVLVHKSTLFTKFATQFGYLVRAWYTYAALFPHSGSQSNSPHYLPVVYPDLRVRCDLTPSHHTRFICVSACLRMCYKTPRCTTCLKLVTLYTPCDIIVPSLLDLRHSVISWFRLTPIGVYLWKKLTLVSFCGICLGP